MAQGRRDAREKLKILVKPDDIQLANSGVGAAPIGTVMGGSNCFTLK